MTNYGFGYFASTTLRSKLQLTVDMSIIWLFYTCTCMNGYISYARDGYPNVVYMLCVSFRCLEFIENLLLIRYQLSQSVQ